MSADEHLRQAVRRWSECRQRARQEPPSVEGAEPGCTFGLLVRDELDDQKAAIEDLKKELEWIRTVIVVAIVSAGIGTLLRLAGWVQ
ncbi:MAG: hypothetical protein BWY10_00812 [Chloroflexi bacterium ADurb.Bin180]|nr:MAG: hypothetical protein BWY10_00812 [Chloroflexi bacterium ADurb.Bin180]HOU23934.1 hypothetical protein [Anaerolineae bacterium]HQJ52709.1 hypothetical protein [Anaerolineae bacterium]